MPPPRARPARPFALVFYDREETPYETNGLRPLFSAEPWLADLDLALMLEPTANRLELGCLGSLHARVSFHGTAAHTARPWLGENAIHKAAPFITRIAEIGEREVRQGPAVYREVISVTLAEGGSTRTVVPDLCTVNVNFRFAPDRSPEDAEAHLRSLLPEGATVEIADLAPAAPARADAPLLARLIEDEGLEAGAKQAWTDVAQFAERGGGGGQLRPRDPRARPSARRAGSRGQPGSLLRSAQQTGAQGGSSMTGAAIPRSPYVSGLPPYPFERLDALRKEVEARGVQVIDLGMGEPREPTPELVKRALIDAIPERSPYPRASGMPSLREAASGWLQRRYGVTVDPDRELLPVNGTKEAVFNLPLAVQSPERPVMMIPDPAYPVYALSARAFGSELYRMPLTKENGFRPDLDAVPEEVWRRASILWINFPGNPTGAMAPPDYYKHAADLARQHGVLLASDEAYGDVYYEDAPHCALEFGLENTLVLHSLSKRSGMAGYRSGFMAGDPRLIADLAKIRPAMGVATPEFMQAAAQAAWSDDAHVERDPRDLQGAPGHGHGGTPRRGVRVRRPGRGLLPVDPGSGGRELGVLQRPLSERGRGGAAGQRPGPGGGGLCAGVADRPHGSTSRGPGPHGPSLRIVTDPGRAIPPGDRDPERTPGGRPRAGGEWMNRRSGPTTRP